MSDPDNVRAALEAAATNPKVATAVSGATIAMGAISLQSVQSFLGIVSLLIGCVVGLWVIRINQVRYRLLKRQLDHPNGTRASDPDDDAEVA